MLHRFRTLTFVPCLALLGLACSNPSAKDNIEVNDDNELTASWFATNVPRGSAIEKGVLALVNDKSMTADDYVETCNFTLAAGAAIVDYRQGDEPADTSDDETFDTSAELDRLPFTDRPFWAAAIACAKAHYAGSGGTCATGTSTVQQSALAIQVVLDGSGSMETGSKWTAAQGALTTLFAAQAAKADDKVGMGLITFSDSKDSTHGAGPYPSPADIAIGSVDAAQEALLTGRLGGDAYDGTPLSEAIVGAYDSLRAAKLTGPLASATKVVVVLTDGVPTTSTPEAVISYVKAHSAEAQLFAVGIGDPKAGAGDYSPKFMSDLAIAGGTQSSANCDPNETSEETKMCHIQVTPNAKTSEQIKDQLLAAFAKMRSDVAACDIGLQTLGTGTVDPANVKVVVKHADGTEATIKKNKAYGWSFDDAKAPTKVLLRGKACNDLRGEVGAVARVEIACK